MRKLSKNKIRAYLNKDIVQFLTNNQALNKYIDNCYNQRVHKADINKIRGAFDWDNTQEGYVYWRTLHHNYELSKSLSRWDD